VTAKVVNGTSLSGIALLPIDSPYQSKLFDIRFQLGSSFLGLRSNIAIALPASARASVTFRFSLVAFHTANPGGVRFQVRSGRQVLIVSVLASNAASFDLRLAKAIVSYWQT
jgi:hypothetical protein